MAIGPVRATDTTVTWLDADATYQWHVSARNDYAWGVESELWQFTTPPESSATSHYGHDPPSTTRTSSIGLCEGWLAQVNDESQEATRIIRALSKH